MVHGDQLDGWLDVNRQVGSPARGERSHHARSHGHVQARSRRRIGGTGPVDRGGRRSFGRIMARLTWARARGRLAQADQKCRGYRRPDRGQDRPGGAGPLRRLGRGARRRLGPSDLHQGAGIRVRAGARGRGGHPHRDRRRASRTAFTELEDRAIQVQQALLKLGLEDSSVATDITGAGRIPVHVRLTAGTPSEAVILRAIPADLRDDVVITLDADGDWDPDTAAASPPLASADPCPRPAPRDRPSPVPRCPAPPRRRAHPPTPARRPASPWRRPRRGGRWRWCRTPCVTPWTWASAPGT